MNYIIFSAQYLPTVGGVERYTNSLAKELIKYGHSVTVVTSALSSVPMTETDADGIQIFRLPCIMLMNGRFPIIKPSKGK
ncbi:MAG: glycosyltransferase [Oscillospiraceae bacterium]|nr:glycosyltransferase [Oscillospiraceae bacterium]